MFALSEWHCWSNFLEFDIFDTLAIQKATVSEFKRDSANIFSPLLPSNVCSTLAELWAHSDRGGGGVGTGGGLVACGWFGADAPIDRVQCGAYLGRSR